MAIGAVAANGGRYLNDALIEAAGVGEDYLEAATRTERAEARRRQELFRGGRPAVSIRGRIVIVVDDGLATGATMVAAVRSARMHNPARLIVAVPVAPHQTCAALRYEADEVIALNEPDLFFAVGLHYRDFTPTSDQEVSALLQDAHERRYRMSRTADGS